MDWILTLFANLIPIESHHVFLTNFIMKGWYYFYQVVILFLKSVEKELLNEDELCDVLVTLKFLATPAWKWPGVTSPPKLDTKWGIIDFIQNIFTSKKEDFDWENHLVKARDCDIDANYRHIAKELKVFDFNI